jgi:hypothetical protein
MFRADHLFWAVALEVEVPEDVGDVGWVEGRQLQGVPVEAFELTRGVQDGGLGGAVPDQSADGDHAYVHALAGQCRVRGQHETTHAGQRDADVAELRDGRHRGGAGGVEECTGTSGAHARQ